VWSLGERASVKWYNNRSLLAMSGTLYVVATPIGNLEDITLRALRVLKDVDLIAAEDTRRTAKLLAFHAIQTPSVSFHEHNTKARMPQLLARLAGGTSIALVTDAGTPGVSDPGVELVSTCIEAGIAVDPIPGASAPLTAAIASGFALDGLTIFGFPPPKANDRRRWLSAISETSHTFTFFESPHRIAATLRDAGGIFGDRPIMVGRELTKAHQEFTRGSAASLLERLGEPRGEYTIVVGPAEIHEFFRSLPEDHVVAEEFGRETDVGRLGRRAAVSALAKRYGRPTREVYAAIERAKSSGQ
jgi:16S rRNA (cytidine1402-2'-O)-methyltransferase